ncbi:MAG: response regulator [Gemmatimonadales bacterium]
MRILIVEDSPLVQEMYRQVFSRRSHELTAAGDGRTALIELAVSGHPYDLILLDPRLPDMDGVEFIRAVRGNSVLGRTPIVLTTAEPGESDLMHQAHALGVAAIVSKPWKPQALRAVIYSILHKPVG